MPSIRVQTTQNVAVEYEIASVGDRILATLVDWAVYVAWLGVIGVIGSESGLKFGPVFGFLLYLPILLYPLGCEVFFNGRTLGKHARSLKIIKRNGAQPGLGDYLLRWLLIPVDLFPFGGVGILSMLVTLNGQRLGDLAAGTVVVKIRARASMRASTFAATEVAGDYQVTFPQAALLSDRDATLIRQLLNEGTRRGDEHLLRQTVQRVLGLTGIPDPGTQSATGFLSTLLRDHAHLAAQEEAGR